MSSTRLTHHHGAHTECPTVPNSPGASQTCFAAAISLDRWTNTKQRWMGLGAQTAHTAIEAPGVVKSTSACVRDRAWPETRSPRASKPGQEREAPGGLRAAEWARTNASLLMMTWQVMRRKSPQYVPSAALTASCTLDLHRYVRGIPSCPNTFSREVALGQHLPVLVSWPQPHALAATQTFDPCAQLLRAGTSTGAQRLRTSWTPPRCSSAGPASGSRARSSTASAAPSRPWPRRT